MKRLARMFRSLLLVAGGGEALYRTSHLPSPLASYLFRCRRCQELPRPPSSLYGATKSCIKPLAYRGLSRLIRTRHRGFLVWFCICYRFEEFIRVRVAMHFRGGARWDSENKLLRKGPLKNQNNQHISSGKNV